MSWRRRNCYDLQNATFSTIMLSVIIRDAILLSVVAPNRENENYTKVCLKEENIHGLCYKTFYNGN
jgi:hypothetical protein